MSMPLFYSTPSTRVKRSLALAMGAVSLAATFAVHASPESSASLYDDASRRYEKSDFVGAALQLKNAVAEDKKNLAAHLMLGQVLLRLGELKAAEATFEEALRQGVSKVEVAPLLGQVYLQLGEPKKLLDTITTVGLPPLVQAEVHTLRGSAMAMTSNFGGATQAFAEARALDPKSAKPLIAEAPVVLRTGDASRAKILALKATEMAPQEASAWFQLGNILQAMNDAPGALAAFDKSLAINTKHVDAHVSRAALLLILKREPEAEAVLKLLKEAKVTEPRASFMRAMIAARGGDQKAAKEGYTEAANLIDAISPALRSASEPLLFAGALSHRALGNSQKTLEYLETLITRNSRNVAATLLMASTLLETNQVNKAAPLVEGLLRAMPNEPQALHLMGRIHIARKQYSQATEMLERAAAVNTDGTVLRDLSFSQLGTGQNKVGLANLEKAYAQNPKDYLTGIELAIFYARQGQNAKAVKTAEAVVSLDPSNLAMLNFLGNIKGRLRDMKGMRETYQLALDKDAAFRPVVMNMSWLDMEEGRIDDARTRLQTYLKTQPKDADVLFQLGLLEKNARRNAEAITLWTASDAAQPKDPKASLALIDIMFAERQTDQALAAAKALNGRFPDQFRVQMVLVRAQLQAGDATAARVVLQEATKKVGFEPEPLMAIARLQLAARNPDGAAHAVSKALQADANDVNALALNVEVAGARGNAADIDKAMGVLQNKHPKHLLTMTTAGHIAFSRGQLPKAIVQYQAAFAREPSTPLAMTLTQAYMANNELAKALALFETWSAKQPADMVAKRALAEMQLLSGKTDAAKRSFEAVVQADPKDATGLAAYANALLKLNDPAAVVTAENAFKLAPNTTPVADTYGWALAQTGNLEAAVRVLREVRLRDPGNGQVRWHLASALAKIGRKAEARDELQAALSANARLVGLPEVGKLKAELGL